MNKKIALFGVAGSGKTTKALEMIKEKIKEYQLEEIAFTTYTRAGVESIKEKLEKAGIILPKINYFRTIHSICWRLCEYDTKQKITNKEQEEFFNKLKVAYKNREEEDVKTIGEYYLEFYEKFQNRYCKKIDLATEVEILDALKTFYETDENIGGSEIIQLTEINKFFIKWKNENNKKMYSDALIETLEQKINLPVKIMIIDEAQDLYALQQKIVEMWFEEFEKELVIIAGDDDQCVHEWAGANPKFLINFSEEKADETILLDKTYRCNQKIVELCNKILLEINYRKEKFMKTELPPGEIEFEISQNYKDVLKRIKKEEKTFVLFRTNRFKKEFADTLFEFENIPFGFIDKNQSKYSKKFCCINNAIQKLSKGEDINLQEAKYLILVTPATKLKRGIKSKFKKGKELMVRYTPTYFFNEIMPLNLYKYSEGFELKQYLVENISFGINAADQVVKERKNDKIKNKLLCFDEIIEINEEKNQFEHNLQLGTFHSSKGLEAENVIVITNTIPYWAKIDDSELRNLYVACSRAKKRLFVTFYPFNANSTSELWDFCKNL